MSLIMLPVLDQTNIVIHKPTHFQAALPTFGHYVSWATLYRVICNTYGPQQRTGCALWYKNNYTMKAIAETFHMTNSGACDEFSHCH